MNIPKLSSDDYSYSITENGNVKTIHLIKNKTIHKKFTIRTSSVEQLIYFMNSMSDVCLNQIIK